MSVTERCRPFLMSDAMLLIAATAAGLAELRSISGPRGSGPTGSVLTILPAWTLAVLILRLRRPRPTLEQLTSQPGFVACLVSGSVASVLHLMASMTPAAVATILYGTAILPGGFGVPSVWIIQKSGHEWRPEPGWLDRAGIGLGVLWSALFLGPLVSGIAMLIFLALNAILRTLV